MVASCNSFGRLLLQLIIVAAVAIAIKLFDVHIPSALSATWAILQVGSDGYFGLGLLLHESLASHSSRGYAPLGYWNSMQLKIIYLSRSIFRDNFIFEDWMNSIHISILRDFESKGYKKDSDSEKSVPIIDMTSADFKALFAQFVSSGEPLVIRNVGVKAMEWTSEKLKSRFEDFEVLLHCKNGSIVGQPFGKYVDSRPPCSLVGGNDDMFETYPDLFDELEIHKFSTLFNGRSTPEHEKPDLFVSADLMVDLDFGIGRNYNCANYFNLFYLVQGKSRWTFVDPSNSLLMYPFFDPSFESFKSWLTWDAIHADNSPDIISQYFPLYRYAPKIVLEMQAGDVLVNPPWSWNMVEQLEAGTIGVATQWQIPKSFWSSKYYSNVLFSFLQFTSTDFIKRTYNKISRSNFASTVEPLTSYSIGRVRNLDNIFNFGKLNSLLPKGEFVKNVVSSEQWENYLNGIIIKAAVSDSNARRL